MFFLFIAYGDLGRGEVFVFTPFGPTIEYVHERTCGALAYMPMHAVHMPIVRTFSFSLDAFWAQASIAIDTKQLKRDTSSVQSVCLSVFFLSVSVNEFARLCMFMYLSHSSDGLAA